MIESVIKLGIKGSDLVQQELKKVQKQKEQIQKPANVKIGKEDFSVRDTFNEKERIEISDREKEKSKEKDEKDSLYKQNLKSELAGARSQAGSSILGFNGTGLAQAGIMGISAFAGPIGTMAGQAFNYVIDAVVAFKEKMKQQAAIVADTASKNNDIFNQLKGNSFSNITRRGDINKTEQAAIVNAISGSMGKLTNEFQQSIGKLFSKGENIYDVNQATSLAQGNFSALGNDKGFFMQQISNGFSNLPPSMKQKLTSQMFNMLTPDDMSLQKDVGIRANQKRFDELDRSQAQKYIGANEEGTGSNKRLENAYIIQKAMYDLDISLGDKIAKLTDTVVRVSKEDDKTSAIIGELKTVVMDLKTTVQGIFR